MTNIFVVTTQYISNIRCFQIIRYKIEKLTKLSEVYDGYKFMEATCQQLKYAFVCFLRLQSFVKKNSLN